MFNNRFWLGLMAGLLAIGTVSAQAQQPAIIAGRAHAELELYLYRLFDGQVETAAISPDSEKIAVAVASKGLGRIHIMSIDDMEARNGKSTELKYRLPLPIKTLQWDETGGLFVETGSTASFIPADGEIITVTPSTPDATHLHALTKNGNFVARATTKERYTKIASVEINQGRRHSNSLITLNEAPAEFDFAPKKEEVRAMAATADVVYTIDRQGTASAWNAGPNAKPGIRTASWQTDIKGANQLAVRGRYLAIVSENKKTRYLHVWDFVRQQTCYSAVYSAVNYDRNGGKKVEPNTSITSLAWVTDNTLLTGHADGSVEAHGIGKTELPQRLFSGKEPIVRVDGYHWANSTVPRGMTFILVATKEDVRLYRHAFPADKPNMRHPQPAPKD